MNINPQHVVLFHEFRKLLSAAAEEGIHVAPLKGAHMLSSHYPVDNDRGHMADVDFLIKPEHWDRTVRVMTDLGFVAEDHGQDHEKAFRKHLENGDSILFEAHRYLFDTRRFFIDHNDIWARAYRSDFEGVECMRLADEDHFCHIAFHSAVHRLSTIHRASMDLSLLAASPTTNLNLVVERAKDWKVTRAVWFFMDLLHKKQPHFRLDFWARELEPPFAVRLALRNLATDKNRLRILKIHHRGQAAIVWPLIFDSPYLLRKMLFNHPFARKLAPDAISKKLNLF